MLNKVRLWVRGKLLMRVLGIAGGLAYFWAVIADKLTSIYVVIPIAIIVSLLITKGDKWLSNGFKKYTKSPSFYVIKTECGYNDRDWLDVELGFKNNSYRLLHVLRLYIRGQYQSYVSHDDHYLGADSIKLQKVLKYNETTSVTVRFMITDKLNNEIEGAGNQGFKITLKFTLIWDIGITHFHIPVTYFPELKYEQFP